MFEKDDNGEIKYIEGIDFVHNKVIFKRNNIYSTEINFSPQIIIDQKLMLAFHFLQLFTLIMKIFYLYMI